MFMLPGSRRPRVREPMTTSCVPPRGGGGADDEIVRPANDWIDKLIHELRAIAAVAIQKNKELAFRRQSVHSRGTGAAITAIRFAHHLHSRLSRVFRRSIGAAVIAHDDFM